MKKSPADELFEGLPVLIVDKWEDINEDFLNQKYKEITSKEYDIRKLYMEYWYEKITAIKQTSLATYNFEKKLAKRSDSVIFKII